MLWWASDGMLCWRSGGTVVPLGKTQDTGVSNPAGYTLNYNEFVVYNPRQIKMRYAVQVRFEFWWQCFTSHNYVCLPLSSYQWNSVLLWGLGWRIRRGPLMLRQCLLAHLLLQLLQLLQPFNGLFSRTTWVSRYQKGKTNLDFTGARDSEWQWHQLGMCKSAPRSRQITTPATHHSVFLQAGCPSCRPTNSVKALKAQKRYKTEFNWN